MSDLKGHVRVTRRLAKGDAQFAGRWAVKAVEFVIEGDGLSVVVPLRATHIETAMPLSGVHELSLTTPYFEEVVAEDDIDTRAYGEP